MNTDQAKKVIVDIFTHLGFSVQVDYVSNPVRGHVFNVNSQELEPVLSARPEISRDLIFLIKRILEKNNPENLKCTIDINGWQSKADANIKMRALNAAEEARGLKADVTLPPMSSYERMVVHSTLAGLPDISTESIGEGRDRRVKLKYQPAI